MFKYIFKSMYIKRVKVILIAVSIIITTCVALMAYNISRQVNEGIVGTAGYYDMIIGPAGSSTQLAMNTLFFTDSPLGTIPYEIVDELKNSGLCNAVIPFCMGDSYNSSRIVGTTPAFLDSKPVQSGEMFSENDIYTCVVGYEAAKAYGLSAGDKIVTSHGLAGTGAEHAASPLTVVGILDKTNTAYDNIVFTSYKTVWAIHGSEGEEAYEENEEDEHEATEGSVCSVLVKSKSLSSYFKLSETYGKDPSLLTINPSTVLREVIKNVDLGAKIVSVLCVIILVMNIFVITVITLLNMYDSKHEISLMRIIGISMKHINACFLVQNVIIGTVSTFLSLVLSRICIAAAGSITASMGIVLNTSLVYPAELLIMLAVFLISVIPTACINLSMSKKDVIS